MLPFNKSKNKKWMFIGLMVSSIFTFGLRSPAEGTSNLSLGYTPAKYIEADSEELVVTYGKDTQIEFSLISQDEYINNVDWYVGKGTALPPGMVLEKTNESQIWLYGEPEFTDQWCFTLVAGLYDRDQKADRTKDEKVLRNICILSNDNAELDYPKFRVGSVLKTYFEGDTVRERLKYDVKSGKSLDSYEGRILSSDLPSGLNVKFQSEYNRFLLSGSTSVVGLFRFEVGLFDDENNVNYKQFQIYIKEKEKDEPLPIYCGSDAYYDDILEQCVKYPIVIIPPSRPSCSYGEYWSEYLDRCVSYGSTTCDDWRNRRNYRCDEDRYPNRPHIPHRPKPPYGGHQPPHGGGDGHGNPPRPPHGGGDGHGNPPRPPHGGGDGHGNPPRPPHGGGDGHGNPPRPPHGGGDGHGNPPRPPGNGDGGNWPWPGKPGPDEPGQPNDPPKPPPQRPPADPPSPPPYRPPADPPKPPSKPGGGGGGGNWPWPGKPGPSDSGNGSYTSPSRPSEPSLPPGNRWGSDSGSGNQNSPPKRSNPPSTGSPSAGHWKNGVYTP